MGKDICGGTKPRMDIGDVKRDLLWGRLAGVGADSEACGTRIDILEEGKTWRANGCGECL